MTDPAVAPLKIIFVRHAETAWSLSGKHTSVTEIELTRHGEEQAKAVGARLRNLALDHLLTSPRIRARRCCELARLGPQTIVDEDLAEWDYGDYEGRTTAQIRVDRPGWNLFDDGCPGGEMPQQVSDRADRLIERLLALAGTIALFSHGHFGCALAARWIGLRVAEGQHFALGPASVNILGYKANDPGLRILERLNGEP
jgi:probable phosphoglycerate mutase